MHVFRLLSSGTEEFPMGTLVITALAGLGNAALIGLINMGAEDASTGESAGPVMVLI